MDNLAIAIIIFSIGYLIGIHHQRAIDEEIPVLFVCTEFDKSKLDFEVQEPFPKFCTTVYYGIWITEETLNFVSEDGIIAKSQENPELRIFFPNINDLPDGSFAKVSKVRKSKMHNQKYLYKRFALGYVLNKD